MKPILNPKWGAKIKKTLQNWQGSYAKGYLSEYFALIYLSLKGYRLRAHRYQTPVGEIDLIMSRNKHLCFIEVKYRRQKQAALFAITPQQQNRIQRAAQLYLQQHPNFLSFECRFDAFLLSPLTWPTHLQRAW